MGIFIQTVPTKGNNSCSFKPLLLFLIESFQDGSLHTCVYETRCYFSEESLFTFPVSSLLDKI